MSEDNHYPPVAPGGTTSPPQALAPQAQPGNQGIGPTVPVPHYTSTMPGGPQSIYHMPVEAGRYREWSIPSETITTNYKP